MPEGPGFDPEAIDALLNEADPDHPDYRGPALEQPASVDGSDHGGRRTPEPPRAFTPAEERRRTEIAGEIFAAAERRRFGGITADANPREHPFTETTDADLRQERYRMSAYTSLDTVRRIVEQPDGLDDLQTRVHLSTLRDTLNRLDLNPTNARLQ